MILVDAIYINNSGGKVLLDYLITKLELSEIRVHFLLDDRIVDQHPLIKKENKITYLKSGLRLRHMFYITNRNKFSKVLCFGNLPPTVKLSVEVITYFHQPLFIKIPREVCLEVKLKIKIKMIILNFIKNNTNKWVVQSDNVRRGLTEKYNLNKEAVILIPFYPPLPAVNKIIRKKHSFVYVSNVGIHKNHQRLIQGFCKFYDKFKIGELGLTVNDEAYFEIELIKSSQLKGYPVVNFGFVNRDKLAEVYASSEYLIFPSLAESFGLGLAESIDSGCKVIGTDLPYTYAICEPSITFNPLSVDDIAIAFEKSMQEGIQPTSIKVKNDIENLIELLK
ncbi:glycosyltransferase [Flavobacterium sp. LB2R40]|uniref:glycosyltransferase n=1 Tax=unclassified Flavobacterium TaxID=196869 RepID=UPI003AAA67CD